MRSIRFLLIAGMPALALVALAAQGAVAQVSLNPTDTPIQNNSPTGPLGPLPSIAAIMFGLGLVILILMIVAHMRYAPRFSRDEEQLKVVRADRVRLGQELPRRAVDISQAVPVVVGPPAIPSATPAAVPAAAAPAPAAAPAAAAPAPAAAPAAAPAPAAATEAPAPAADAPAAPADAPAPPAAEERPEVSLDEEVFQQTLEELLAKGTSRRVAEGQARRAAMLAARKKAGG